MREEDIRAGTSVTRISAEGRGPLIASERRALEQQHRNRATDGMTPGEVAECNLRAISTTSNGLKVPRFIRDPRP